MAGSIEQRGAGVYRVRVSAGVDPVTRERRVIRKTVRGTEQDAQLELARLLVQHADGTALGTNATVADLIAAWLPQAKLEPTTRDDYERVARLFILPRIGNVSLTKLKPYTLDRLYGDLERDGVSAVRIRKVHTVLRSALRRAVKWTWVTANPAVDAEPPRVEQNEAAAPEPGQVRALFELAAKTNPPMKWLVFFRLAALLGARRGEMCGLCWSDVDFERLVITVRRTVGVVKGKPFVKTWKSNERRGKRREAVPISPKLATLLKEWRLASGEARLASGGDWVFPGDSAGGFMHPVSASRQFRRLRTAAGMPDEVTLHGLRHYVGTYLDDQGVRMDVISRRLGHSRTSTTSNMYGHRVDGRAVEATEILDRLTGDA